MAIPSDRQLLEQVEGFLSRTKIAPSRLGLEALSDGALISQLRKGRRSLTLKSADRLLRYMEQYERAVSEQAPASANAILVDAIDRTGTA